MAIGNLAAYRLQRERSESLSWQVIRIERSRSYDLRRVIRHPERVLDVGIGQDLKRILDSLSDETVEDLRSRFEAARREGLKPAAFRHLHEGVDFGQDNYGNWVGLVRRSPPESRIPALAASPGGRQGRADQLTILSSPGWSTTERVRSMANRKSQL